MSQPRMFSISCPTQIQFGVGVGTTLTSSLPDGAKSVAVITGSSGIAAGAVLRELRRLGLKITQVRCSTEPSVPSISSALQMLQGKQIDTIIACGGGSVIDTGKVIAFLLSHNLQMDENFDRFDQKLLAQPSPIPCIAIPTTAGTGAEVTANAVIAVPSKGAKISLRGRALHPATALVDPSLMKSAPAQVILRSGLDAVTQIIEAYTSNAATPFSDSLSHFNIDKGLRALRGVVESNDAASWNDLAWVSLASGLALANSGLGAAHGLAAIIGGQYEAPHGALCGRCLIPVLRRNFDKADVGTETHKRLAECGTQISKVFPSEAGHDQFSGFALWIRAKNLPRLSDWGVRPAELDTLATEAMGASSSRKNPVPLTKQDFIQILEEAL